MHYMTAAIDITTEGPCTDPEPYWEDGIPKCARACPHYIYSATIDACGMVTLPLRTGGTGGTGKVCVPAVLALARHAAGHRLPLWAQPPAELVPLKLQDVAEER